MRPTHLLALLLAFTLLAWTAHALQRSVRRRQLRSLARLWHMGYTQHDLFNLAPRIAPRLHVPAAADLRVLDLVHGSEGDRHRYVFTAEYTLGVVTGQRRCRQVMTFCEPRDAAEPCPAPLVAAPPELPILDQYRHLHDHQWQDPASRPALHRNNP